MACFLAQVSQFEAKFRQLKRQILMLSGAAGHTRVTKALRKRKKENEGEKEEKKKSVDIESGTGGEKTGIGL